MRVWAVAVLLGAFTLGARCTPGPVTLECVSEKDCEDGNSCTVNPCDDTGSDPSAWFCQAATELPDGSSCDLELGSGALDGFCNAGTCLADECTPDTTDTACDDDNSCTIESCDQTGSLNMCVNDAEAAFNDVCDFNGPGLCDGTGVCGQCNVNGDCTADPNKDLCRTEANPRVCVECLSGLDCVDDPDGENCNVVTKECDPGCNSDSDCNTEPVRDRCFVPGGGLGSCVECLSSSDCSGDAPFCESNQCTAQPTFSGTITVDCQALESLAVDDIMVTIEAIPQGVPTAGEPIEIVFNVVETALDFPILAAFTGCPIDVLADGDQFPPDPAGPLPGEIRLETVAGGSGTAVARTVSQALPIVNPLAIPNIATGSATFTPDAGATTLSIGLDSITMHLVAPTNVSCEGPLLTKVECPFGPDAPSGVIEIPLEPAP